MTGTSTLGSQPMNIINQLPNSVQTLVPLTSMIHQQIVPATGHLYTISNPSNTVPVMTSQLSSGLVHSHGMNQNIGLGQHLSLVQPQSTVSTLIHVPATVVNSKFQFYF